MKYFAPITDYVPKSTFEISDFYFPIYGNGGYFDGGYFVSGAGNVVEIKLHMRPVVFSITEAYLVYYGVGLTVNNHLTVQLKSGGDGDTYYDNSVTRTNVDIGATDIDVLGYYDITTMFSGVNAEDSVLIKALYSATVIASNICVLGVYLKYSL